MAITVDVRHGGRGPHRWGMLRGVDHASLMSAEAPVSPSNAQNLRPKPTKISGVPCPSMSSQNGGEAAISSLSVPAPRCRSRVHSVTGVLSEMSVQPSMPFRLKLKDSSEYHVPAQTVVNTVIVGVQRQRLGISVPVLRTEIEHLRGRGQLHTDETSTATRRTSVGIGWDGEDHLRSSILVQLHNDRTRKSQPRCIAVAVGPLDGHALPIKGSRITVNFPDAHVPRITVDGGQDDGRGGAVELGPDGVGGVGSTVQSDAPVLFGWW